jgi:excisionase family DNA binding protein
MEEQGLFGSERDGLAVNRKRLVVDIREAGFVMSLSPWTIRKWIRLGKIPAIRLGRRVLIEPRELRRLLKSARAK